MNIRIVVMNNLLPSGVIYHEKFDLKGSTYKRKASGGEQKKKSPTFKDLDFMEKHEEVGIPGLLRIVFGFGYFVMIRFCLSFPSRA